MSRSTPRRFTHEDGGMKTGRAVPILPARDLEENRAYYALLGFAQFGLDHPEYRLMARDTWELHFFHDPNVDPDANSSGAYLRCDDVDALDAEWGGLDLPQRGNSRLIRVEDKPWGMRELALIDLNGTLLRVGQEIT